MRRAVGFRNVLVHEYVTVDDSVVLARLEDPGDLRDFVSAVTEWVGPALSGQPTSVAARQRLGELLERTRLRRRGVEHGGGAVAEAELHAVRRRGLRR